MEKSPQKRKRVVRLIALAVMVLLLAAAFFWIWSHDTTPVRSLSEARQLITAGKVQEATLYEAAHEMELRTAEGTYDVIFLAEAGDELVTLLNDSGTPYQVKADRPGGGLWDTLTLMASLMVVPAILVGAMFYMNRGSLMGGRLSKQDYQAERPKVRFSDVKGAQEAIERLSTLVDFLQNPKKYDGIRVSRGILLYGPPGSGKTLLAEALAGEADCIFYRLAGADFGSVFQHGTGLQIKGMFEGLRKKFPPKTPLIVYIDELDGIASSRTGETPGERDSNSAVTQLLQQISLFFEHFPYGVIIGSSNRNETLDEAVVRSQRLGLHIAVPGPDAHARREILEANAEGMNLQNVDFGDVAQLTVSMSGASVADIPHLAATDALRQGGEGAAITRRHLEQATIQVVFGTLRPSALMSEADQAVSAVHESGHSIVAHASPYHSLLIVTTYKIADSGGSTWAPPIDQMVLTRESLIWRMAVMLGSREAEMIAFGTISTGAAHDIESATALATHAVCEWGIIDGFVMKIDVDDWHIHPRAADIDAAIKGLIDEASAKAQQVLLDNGDLLRRLQQELRDKRILHSDELAELTGSALAA